MSTPSAVPAVVVALLLAVASPVAPEPDPAQRFLDETVSAQLVRHGIPGAVAVVVADGKQVAAGGYGVVELGSPAPPDPERSTVPINSVGKVLTAMAVMQQVERGTLTLDGDVRPLVPEIDLDGAPITVHHLLTHTAGFEEVILSPAAPPADLAGWLAAHEPQRVHEPGRFSSYSNYGYALLGHLVEVVTGRPYPDHLRENVLTPLGMHATHLGVPVPATLAQRLATTYDWTVDGPRTARQPYVALGPAGIGVTSAADMGRLLLAVLDGGGGVLAPSTVALMRQRRYEVHPALTGLGYPFFERRVGGVDILWFGGNGHGSHSAWAIDPAGGWGVYVAFTGSGTGPRDADVARDAVVVEAVARFATGAAPPRQPPSSRPPDRSVEGSYASLHTNWSGVFSLPQRQQDLVVTVGAGGAVEWRSGVMPWSGGPLLRWEPVAPDVYREPTGNALPAGADTIAFLRDPDGVVTGMVIDSSGATTFVRVPWYAAVSTHLAGLVAALAVLVVVVLVTPAAAALRRLRSRPGRPGAAVRWVVWTSALTALAATVGIAAVLADPIGMQVAAEARAPWLLALLLVPLLPAAGVVAGAGGLVVAGVRRWWSPAAVVGWAVGVLALAAWVAFVVGYHLVGWQFT